MRKKGRNHAFAAVSARGGCKREVGRVCGLCGRIRYGLECRRKCRREKINYLED